MYVCVCVSQQMINLILYYFISFFLFLSKCTHTLNLNLQTRNTQNIKTTTIIILLLIRKKTKIIKTHKNTWIVWIEIILYYYILFIYISYNIYIIKLQIPFRCIYMFIFENIENIQQMKYIIKEKRDHFVYTHYTCIHLIHTLILYI